MDRRFAVGKVLEVRGDRELGDAVLRLRHTPKHNFQAKKCHNLIALEKEVMHKPIFTCNINKTNIKAIIQQPLQVPYCLLHTQSTERAVKLTTDVSNSLFGFDKHNGFILSMFENRQETPSLPSQKNVVKLFQM